ncbi:MAG: xylulokinase, partial [Saprospiraceae bacterium]
ANLLGCNIEVIKTTGAAGAAKASGIGVGIYSSLEDASKTNEIEKVYKPRSSNESYFIAYRAWGSDLIKLVSK